MNRDESAETPPLPDPPDEDAGAADADKFAPRNFSEVMTFEATLEIGSGGPPGSKGARSNFPWLIRDDGAKWLAVTREDLSAYDGKQVRVTGRTFDPSPYTAHLGAQHFEVQIIEVVEAD